MYKKSFVGTAPDYSEKGNWLALPENADKDADLIYFYPSSCTDPEAPVICPSDDPVLREAAKRNCAQQAAAFEPVANIYAPFWRQVNGRKLLMMSPEEADEAKWAEPRTDVYAALDYYFENLNNGRPFFLAGHSQGSSLCFIILSEYMKEHPEYYANMIAAYCIGSSLTKKYLEENPHVTAAKAADDLGVVVSWNTEGPANKDEKSFVVSPGAVGINPLNWCIDEMPAEAELNLGSFVPHPEDEGMDELPIKADAVLDRERGSVMVMNPDFARYAMTANPGSEELLKVFGPASYHSCDYSFFFMNIRENARVRSEAWFEKNGKIYTCKIGGMTLETNIQREEAEDFVKTKLRGAAKDVAVQAVKAARSAGKMTVDAINSAVDSAKAAAEESKPVIEEGFKKVMEKVGNSIEAAKPVLEKAAKETGAFIDEVKEEVKKEEVKKDEQS